MGKTICDWSKKELEKNAGRLFQLTRDATHYCKKCGRVANTPKVLCKAQKFSKKLSQEEENPE